MGTVAFWSVRGHDSRCCEGFEEVDRKLQKGLFGAAKGQAHCTRISWHVVKRATRRAARSQRGQQVQHRLYEFIVFWTVSERLHRQLEILRGHLHGFGSSLRCFAGVSPQFSLGVAITSEESSSRCVEVTALLELSK